MRVTTRTPIARVIEAVDASVANGRPIDAIKMMRKRWPRLGLGGSHAIVCKRWDEFVGATNRRAILRQYGA